MSINDTMRFLKLAMVKIIGSARSKQKPALVSGEGCEDDNERSEHLQVECPSAQAWHEDARFADPGQFGSLCFLTGKSRPLYHIDIYPLTCEAMITRELLCFKSPY